MVPITLLHAIQGEIFILAPRQGSFRIDGNPICVKQMSLGLFTPELLFLAKHFSNPVVNRRDTKRTSASASRICFGFMGEPASMLGICASGLDDSLTPFVKFGVAMLTSPDAPK